MTCQQVSICDSVYTNRTPDFLPVCLAFIHVDCVKCFKIGLCPLISPCGSGKHVYYSVDHSFHLSDIIYSAEIPTKPVSFIGEARIFSGGALFYFFPRKS